MNPDLALFPGTTRLQFALENSKPSDAITLGLSSIAEVEESLQFVTDYLSQNPETHRGEMGVFCCNASLPGDR
jgi:hypothetical protein